MEYRNFGTFQTSVDRFNEPPGGGMMVIQISNRYDSSPSPTNQRQHDEVYQTPRLRSPDPYPSGHARVAASRGLRDNDGNLPVLSDIQDLPLMVNDEWPTDRPTMVPSQASVKYTGASENDLRHTAPETASSFHLGWKLGLIERCARGPDCVYVQRYPKCIRANCQLLLAFRERYRNFKRHCSAGTSEAQPLQTPLEHPSLSRRRSRLTQSYVLPSRAGLAGLWNAPAPSVERYCTVWTCRSGWVRPSPQRCPGATASGRPVWQARGGNRYLSVIASGENIR